MYFLYSFITALGVAALSPYFLVKGIRQRKYLSNLPERFAWRFPPELRSGQAGGSRTIWLHAVSVGETLAAVPLARAIKARFPACRLVVSTTTQTGQEIARERVSFADAVFYFPFDWRGPLRRVLRTVRPDAIVILETEIWPNLLREARRSNVPVVFVNARFSDRSFARMSRALSWFGRPLRSFVKDVLNQAALFLTQSEKDRDRLLSLGADPERVAVGGNLKYDLAPPAPNPFVAWLASELERSDRRPLVVAGSVVAGEEHAVLEGFTAVTARWPQAMLLLAPRKPERFAASAEIAEHAGWRVIRRSALSLNGSSQGVLRLAANAPRSILILDTIGELAAAYGAADAVFIGGSLQNGGGHNPLEPAEAGRVPVFGASMENFKEIAEGLLRDGAALQVRSGAELGAAWNALLGDKETSTRMGAAAQRLLERHRGATAAAIERIAEVLGERRSAH